MFARIASLLLIVGSCLSTPLNQVINVEFVVSSAHPWNATVAGHELNGRGGYKVISTELSGPEFSSPFVVAVTTKGNGLLALIAQIRINSRIYSITGDQMWLVGTNTTQGWERNLSTVLDDSWHYPAHCHNDELNSIATGFGQGAVYISNNCSCDNGEASFSARSVVDPALFKAHVDRCSPSHSQGIEYFVLKNETKTTAKKHCEKYGASLAAITNNQEYFFLNRNACIKERTWYQSWNGDAFAANCIVMSPGKDGGATTQEKCGHYHPALCKKVL